MIFLLILLLIAVCLGIGIFNTWMFANAVAEPDPDTRSYWVFMVKFLGPIGAVLYFFKRYR